MSDLITDEMVEAGVVAVWNSDLLSKGYYTWETVPITSESRKLWLKDIRAALEAAAPLIAAAARAETTTEATERIARQIAATSAMTGRDALDLVEAVQALQNAETTTDLYWSNAAAMDLWWRIAGDDWPVPNDLPGRFLRAAARAETVEEA